MLMRYTVVYPLSVLVKFKQLPSHLCEELHVFAMDDLIKIKRGQLFITTKAVMQFATTHVEACEVCIK